jgi:hypothetical protein
MAFGMRWRGAPLVAFLTATLSVAVAATALGLPARAHAQEPEDYEYTEDSGDVATDAEAAPESGEASAWAQPRILVLGDRGTPAYVVRALRDVLVEAGDVIDASDFVTAAREMGLAPVSDEAFERFLPAVDCVLVVVVSAPGRARLARFSYRAGNTGLTLLEERHPMGAGGRMDAATARTVLAETRLAVAALTRPGEGSPAAGTGDESDDGAEGDDASGGRVRFTLGVGSGIGMRAFDGPAGASGAAVRLATDPFPAVGLTLGVAVEPDAGARLTVRGRVRYLSSAGLRTTDLRLDGTTRITASRAQSVSVDVGLGYRLGADAHAASIEAALGFSTRAFSSNALVALPDYGLGGPHVRLGATLPLGARFAFTLGADAQWLALVSSALQGLGAGAGGVTLGFEGGATLGLFDAFALEALYRESHALVSDGARGGATDVERWVTLAAVYRR